MKKSTCTALFLSLAIFGCNKSSNNKATSQKEAGPILPQKIDFQTPVESEKLTAEQLNEIKLMFSKKPMMILPPGELIFKNEKLTELERAQKEKQLRKQDLNSYEMLKEIQADCKAEVQKPTVDSSFKSNERKNISDFRMNDFYKVMASSVLRGGANCPAQLDFGLSTNATVDFIDHNTKSIKVSGQLGSKIKGLILKPKYSKLLGSSGIIVDAKLSGLMAKRTAVHDYQIKYSLQGAYLTLTQEIPYQTQVEVLANGSEETCKPNALSADGRKCEQTFKNLEIVAKTELTMPNFKVDLQLHMTQKSENQKSRVIDYFINGHRMNEKEIEQLFGKMNPATNPNQSKIIETLN